MIDDEIIKAATANASAVAYGGNCGPEANASEAVYPRLVSMSWCEHWPKPGEAPEAGEFLSYSLELAKAYGKGKLALGYDVWINEKQWFGE